MHLAAVVVHVLVGRALGGTRPQRLLARQAEEVLRGPVVVLEIIDHVVPRRPEAADKVGLAFQVLRAAIGLDDIEIGARLGKRFVGLGRQQGNPRRRMGRADDAHGTQRLHEIAHRAEFDHQHALERGGVDGVLQHENDRACLRLRARRPNRAAAPAASLRRRSPAR